MCTYCNLAPAISATSFGNPSTLRRDCIRASQLQHDENATSAMTTGEVKQCRGQQAVILGNKSEREVENSESNTLKNH